MTPAWPLTQQCTTLWSGLLPTKFGSHRVFPRQLDLWMTFDLWWGHFENMPIPNPHAKYQPHTSKHGETHSLEHLQLHNAMLHWLHLMALRISKQLPSGWPLINPSSHMAFLSNFTSSWPQQTPARPMIPSMHCTLVWGPWVAIGHFWGMWPLVDPSWPLHDLWPQQCITLWSGCSSHQIWWS